MKYFPITLLCFFISASSAPKELLLEPFKVTKQSAIEFNLEAQDSRNIGASMGKRFAITDILYYGPIACQLDVEANTNIGLYRAYNESFKLRTMDFFIGIPVVINYEDLFYTLEMNHISDHMGDGFNRKTLDKKIIYSREYVSNFLTYRILNKHGKISPYIGVGKVLRVYPSRLGSKFIEVGVEAFLMEDVFVYSNFEYNQDTRYLNQTFRTGIKPFENLGFYVNFYTGADKRGQFYKKYITYQTIGVFLE